MCGAPPPPTTLLTTPPPTMLPTLLPLLPMLPTLPPPMLPLTMPPMPLLIMLLPPTPPTTPPTTPPQGLRDSANVRKFAGKDWRFHVANNRFYWSGVDCREPSAWVGSRAHLSSLGRTGGASGRRTQEVAVNERELEAKMDETINSIINEVQRI